MSSLLSFRLATLNDRDVLTSIATGTEQEYQSVNEEMFQRIIPEERVLLCQDLEGIIGLLYFQKHFWGRTNIYYLEQITIRKKFRKKGYGQKFLEYFVSFAKERGIQKVFADVHNDNRSSLCMFLNAGGLISGTIEGLGNTKEKDERVIIRFEL